MSNNGIISGDIINGSGGASTPSEIAALVAGQSAGTFDTYADLPDVDLEGNPLLEGDTALVTEATVGTGTEDEPEYPSGSYKYKNGEWVVSLASLDPSKIIDGFASIDTQLAVVNQSVATNAGKINTLTGRVEAEEAQSLLFIDSIASLNLQATGMDTRITANSDALALATQERATLASDIDSLETSLANEQHNNRPTLDKFGEDANGKPTYNGVAVDHVIAQRDVYDGLDSIDNTISLSAKQGKQLHDNEVAHEADTNNPHEVTKAQVGLSNVDNTSDLDKPVSTAVQTALNTKLTIPILRAGGIRHDSLRYTYSSYPLSPPASLWLRFKVIPDTLVAPSSFMFHVKGEVFSYTHKPTEFVFTGYWYNNGSTYKHVHNSKLHCLVGGKLQESPDFVGRVETLKDYQYVYIRIPLDRLPGYVAIGIDVMKINSYALMPVAEIWNCPFGTLDLADTHVEVDYRSDWIISFTGSLMDPTRNDTNYIARGRRLTRNKFALGGAGSIDIEFPTARSLKAAYVSTNKSSAPIPMGDFTFERWDDVASSYVAEATIIGAMTDTELPILATKGTETTKWRVSVTNASSSFYFYDLNFKIFN